MDYARAIRVLRAASGLSQADFAVRIGKTASTVSRLEAGDRNPSPKLIEEICEAFKMPVHLFTLLAADNSEVLSKEESDSISKVLLSILLDLDNKS